MRIKATDANGKIHWFHERPNNRYVWGLESNATQMPKSDALKWASELDRVNRYLDSDDRMAIEIDKRIL